MPSWRQRSSKCGRDRRRAGHERCNPERRLGEGHWAGPLRRRHGPAQHGPRRGGPLRAGPRPHRRHRPGRGRGRPRRHRGGRRRRPRRPRSPLRPYSPRSLRPGRGQGPLLRRAGGGGGGRDPAPSRRRRRSGVGRLRRPARAHRLRRRPRVRHPHPRAVLHRARPGVPGRDPTPSADNAAHRGELAWGDAEAALAAATTVVETTATFPLVYGYAMETYNALADWQPGSLHVVSTAQHPLMVRKELARMFSLPLAAVRVEVPYIGGGYGSKSYTKLEPLAAAASWASGRPVKVTTDVEAAMYTTRADGAVVTVRTGFDPTPGSAPATSTSGSTPAPTPTTARWCSPRASTAASAPTGSPTCGCGGGGLHQHHPGLVVPGLRRPPGRAGRRAQHGHGR